MLATRDVPAPVEALYAEAKDLGATLYNQWVQALGTVERLSANTDVLTYIHSPQVIYILEGYLHLTQADKAVRLYSDQDFLLLDTAMTEFRLASEFACEIAFFALPAFLEHLAGHPPAQLLWNKLQTVQQAVNLGLVAANLTTLPEDDFEFRQFKPGECILQEGDDSTAIYELITGRADVRRGPASVGQIQAGELFGEMSFFAESRRMASVFAVDPCLVRIVKREHFSALMQNNPNLALAIARTLANRIGQLNEQVVHLGA